MIIKFCCKTAPFYSADFPRALSRAFYLCRRHKYSPDEAFELGLLNPNLPAEQLSNFLSRKTLTKLQKALSPVSWVPLIKDKGIFHRFCTAIDVPVPKLYAVFFRTIAGWAFDGSILATRNDWERFFSFKAPSEFVIKPSQGSFGEKVFIFTKTGAYFTDSSAKQYKAADIYELMLSDHKFDSFIIQERLKNHPDLTRLTGTEFLQTVRFITSVDTQGRSRILHAFFKMILGQNIVDNWQHGLAGNAKADISLSDGYLRPAIMLSPDHSEAKTIPSHPKTGVPFDSFQLPFWPDACKLVEQAATKLLPLRTIGWDVAITPNGPVILEANIWWDPLNSNPSMKIISEALHNDAQLPDASKTNALKSRNRKRQKRQPCKIILPVKKFEEQVREFFRIVRFSRIAAPLHSPDYFKVFLRALRLWRKNEFLPKEAFQFGLFKPDISDREIAECISTSKMTQVMLSINPLPWAPLLRNKSIFYRYCMASGVPIPQLYAIFFRENAGWSCNCPVLSARKDWENFFELHLPSEFVIKPSDSFMGRRINVFTRTDKGFVDFSGKLYDAADLYDDLSSDPKYDSFIIQQRLVNHPELIRFTDNQFLQTLRIITCVNTAGRCSIIHANLKLILGQAVVDNWQRGLTGNATALVSLDDGLLQPAVAVPQNGSQLRTIPVHPKTGIPFNQFRLPFWPEVCSLVRDNANKFLPVRTIGWDVALTPAGPLILEANIWWSAPNQHRRMSVILKALRE